MIIDNLKNASLYYGVHSRIASALQFLQENEMASHTPGKYELAGNKIYFLVQHYNSKPQDAGLWEAHRKYFDIQYIAEGTELMGYAPIDRMKEVKSYIEEGDYAWFEGDGSFNELQAGYFAILAPQDVHMPCISVKDAQPVKKIVFKVLV
jgi:biofilm protein TabA